MVGLPDSVELELDMAIAESGLGVVGVDLMVMPRAQQGSVVERGGPVIPPPVVEMVGLAPSGRSVTTGVGATAVPIGQGEALGRGEKALGASLVEWRRGPIENPGQNSGLASEPPGL